MDDISTEMLMNMVTTHKLNSLLDKVTCYYNLSSL